VTAPFPQAPGADLNQSLFWRENESLRVFLHNMFQVHDAAAPTGRNVPAYFRFSEQEQRPRQFPYILIDPLGPMVESDREMRGYVKLPWIYTPDGVPSTSDTSPVGNTDEPVPLLLRYTVSTNTRFRHHDMELLQAFSVFFLRFGAMNTVAKAATNHHAAIRDDMSRRRIDLLAGPVQADETAQDEARTRTFRRVWTLGVSAEIFLSDIIQPVEVETVFIDPASNPEFESLD
jgi:hypothetical protein